MRHHVLRLTGWLLIGCGPALCGACSSHVYVYDQTAYAPQDDATTFAQIEAAEKMTFSNDRRDLLLRIASRPDLSDAAQVRLAEAALGKLVFTGQQERVLMRLIRNPCFTDASATYLLGEAKRLVFSSSRKRVMNALLDRGETRVAHQPPKEVEG